MLMICPHGRTHFGMDAEIQAMEGNQSGKYSANPLNPTKPVLTT
jgi:hypothetical protein